MVIVQIVRLHLLERVIQSIKYQSVTVGHRMTSQGSRMGSCLSKEKSSSPKRMKTDHADGAGNGSTVVGLETQTGSNDAVQLPKSEPPTVGQESKMEAPTSIEVPTSMEVPTPKKVSSRPDPDAETYFDEESIGITEFIPSSVNSTGSTKGSTTGFTKGSTKGFKCVMKKRYSDFLVNEIDPSGQIVHLTDLSCPVLGETLSKEESIEWLTKRLTQEEMEKMATMAANRKHDKKSTIQIDVDDMDKEERTMVHRCIKVAFGGKLFTQTSAKTVEKPSVKMEKVKNPESQNPESQNPESRNPETEEKMEVSPAKSVPVEVVCTKDERKMITIGLQNQWKGTGWRVVGKDYTTFTVYHESRGTSEVIRTLSTMLNMSSKSFWYRGQKDKKSISVQRISAYRVSPDNLFSISAHLAKGNSPIAIGNYTFEKDHLRLGDSQGNHFRLVFRNVRPVSLARVDGSSGNASEEELVVTIKESFEKIKNNGFINYFGTQRFGTGTRTDKIGLLLLKRQFEEAVRLILVPKKKDITVAPKRLPLPANFRSNPRNSQPENSQRASDGKSVAKESNERKEPNEEEKKSTHIESIPIESVPIESVPIESIPIESIPIESVPIESIPERRMMNIPSYNECMKEWQESRDSVSVYRLFNWKKSNEGLLFHGLVKSGNNYQTAFLSLPRNCRTMYIHAYQSFLFNTLLSMRIRKYGLKVLIGDLVILGNGNEGEEEKEDEDYDATPQEKKGKKKTGDREEDFKTNPTLEPVIVDQTLMNHVSIFDVVFPLVGRKTRLPENEFKDRLIEMMKKDGITFDNFDTNNALSMNGSYRKIISRPRNLSWEMVDYVDETIRLFDTDLDVLNGIKNAQDGVRKETDLDVLNGIKNAQDGVRKETGSAGDGAQEVPRVKKALKVEVSLGSSCYATVFARELTKGNVEMEWSRDGDD